MGELAPVADQLQQEGGCILTSYRDPPAGPPLLLAALPIDRVQPAPFQRDLSDAPTSSWPRSSEDGPLPRPGDRGAGARRRLLEKVKQQDLAGAYGAAAGEE